MLTVFRKLVQGHYKRNRTESDGGRESKHNQEQKMRFIILNKKGC